MGNTNVWEHYKFLFDMTQDMVFYFGADGKVTECNHSAYKQLGFEEQDDIWMQEIFRACVRLEHGRLHLMEDKLGNEQESIVYRKNQTCFPVQVQFMFFEGGMGATGVCMASNATLKRDAQKKLVFAREEVEESQKERNEMVANVTHELRTPVNGVMGLAQNLMDTGLTPEQRDMVELIDHCCKNMIKIINDILDFSKLQQGKFTIENRQFDFYKMMNEIVRTNKPQVEGKGLRLECNVSENIPEYMIGDELRLTQIVNNLLSNAIKFTSIGQIVINVIKTVDLPDDEIELFFMVIDSGIGIAENEKDKLFRSFSQVDASITRKYGGTGLGLSIVRNLVQMMGGDVNVESEKGRGSTFSFSVHLKRVPEQSQEVKEEPQEEFAFHFGAASVGPDEGEAGEVFKLGSESNLREIGSNMEKLVLCIEMENWDKANTFAENIKQLVAEDAMNLKRKAFRLQMTVRKGQHDPAIEEYEVLREAIEEFKAGR